MWGGGCTLSVRFKTANPAPTVPTYILSPYEIRLWEDLHPQEPYQTWRLDDENLPVTSI